jgi:hypothetical protein
MSYRGHSIRMLGIALIAAFAMSAVAASAASAAEFQAAEYPAKVNATNVGAHTFKAGAIGTISCNNATFTGTEFLAGPSTSLTVTPAYSGCTFLGVVGVVVHTNGCTYRFNEPVGTRPSFTGSVDVLCPTGNAITFTAGTCTVSVPAQTGLETVEYTDVTSGGSESVTVAAGVSGIAYTGSVLCPNEPGTHANGEYSGTAKSTAENELSETVNAFIE